MTRLTVAGGEVTAIALRAQKNTCTDCHRDAVVTQDEAIERYLLSSNQPGSRQQAEPMHVLEDLKVVDGQPVAASLIPRAVTAGELLFDDGATQTFAAQGDTSYVEADGRPTQGKWYVDEDGRFCSFWPPTYRACYGLLWIVEGEEIVGLSFTEPGRGTRFDGRYRTPARGPRP